MKKTLTVFCLIVLAVTAVTASTFEGRTDIALNYSWRGSNMGGLSVNSSGYSSDFPIGYTVNVNADFDPTTGYCNAITMLVAPSYRYSIEGSGMDIELAIGASLTGADIGGEGRFMLGVGGFLGAVYNLSNGMNLNIGCQVGYDMLSVPFSGGTGSCSGVFYVTPSIGFGFNY